MEINKVLHVATFAGQIILENGGETYRVEETIWRICAAFGISFADSFVTPTGMIATVSDEYNLTTSIVKRIKNRTVDLEKISRVNALARSIKSRNLTVDEFYDELLKIEQCPRYNNWLTMLAYAAIAASFTILFGGNIKDTISAFIIGIIIRIISKFGNELNINTFFINSLGGAVTEITALLLVNLGVGTNVDKIVIGTIMSLVPGLAITNAIRDTISGDLVSGLTRAAEAFLIAISIAVGTGAVLSLWLQHFGGI